MSLPMVIEDQDDKFANVKMFFSGRLRDSMDALPESLTNLSLDELENRCSPTQVDWLVRHQFWNLIETAGYYKWDSIPTTKVYASITYPNHFYRRFIHDQERLAWLIQPIEREKIINQEIYYQLSKKVRDFVMVTPLTLENSDIFLKLLKHSSERAFGPPVQRLETKSHNVNVEVSAERPEAVSPEEIRARIKELDNELKAKELREVNVEAE